MTVWRNDLIIRKSTKGELVENNAQSFINFILRRRVIINLAEVDKYSMMTLDPEFKGVVFQYVTNALYINQINHKNFTLKICRESLMTNHLVFYFRKGFYLYKEVNEKIRMFKQSGIINFFTTRYADNKFKNTGNDNEGPSQLTVNHFIGIFQLWAFGLFVSTILFISERIADLMLRLKAKNAVKRWKNFKAPIDTPKKTMKQQQLKILPFKH